MQDKVFVDEKVCKGCGLCISACPKQILVLSSSKINAKGYNPAQCIDQEACIACAFCATICPDVAITIKDNK